MKISQEQADAVVVAAFAAHEVNEDIYILNSVAARFALEGAFGKVPNAYSWIPLENRRRWSEILHVLADAVGPAEGPPQNSLDGS